MKVGIVGCGLNSDYHIDFVGSYPNAEIVGVADKDEEKAKQCAAQYLLLHLSLAVNSKKVAGSRILTPWKLFRSFRWWSPETIKSALPSTAADRYMLSFGSSLTASILVLPETKKLIRSAFLRNFSTFCGVRPCSFLSLGYKSTALTSERMSSDKIRIIFPSSANFKSLAGLERDLSTVLTKMLASKTTLIIVSWLLVSCRCGPLPQ